MFSFTRRKKQTDVREYLQRVLNRTTPVVTAPDGRAEGRYSRSMAVIIVPWADGPALRESTFGLVQNLSDRGAGVVTNRNVQAAELLCGFWMDELQLVLGEVRSTTAIGGGHWLLGVEFNEMISWTKCPELDPLRILAEGLLPPESAQPIARAG